MPGDARRRPRHRGRRRSPRELAACRRPGIDYEGAVVGQIGLGAGGLRHRARWRSTPARARCSPPTPTSARTSAPARAGSRSLVRRRAGARRHRRRHHRAARADRARAGPRGPGRPRAHQPRARRSLPRRRSRPAPPSPPTARRSTTCSASRASSAARCRAAPRDLDRDEARRRRAIAQPTRGGRARARRAGPPPSTRPSRAPSPRPRRDEGLARPTASPPGSGHDARPHGRRPLPPCEPEPRARGHALLPALRGHAADRVPALPALRGLRLRGVLQPQAGRGRDPARGRRPHLAAAPRVRPRPAAGRSPAGSSTSASRSRTPPGARRARRWRSTSSCAA